MDLNKIISLILGFVVLILIFVWLNNKFRSGGNNTTANITPTATITIAPTQQDNNNNQTWGPFSFLFNNDKTPTPTKKQTETSQQGDISPTSKVVVKVIEGLGTSPNITITTNTGAKTQYQSTNNPQNTNFGQATSIPETGAASIFLPIAFSAAAAGVYLLKKS